MKKCISNYNDINKNDNLLLYIADLNHKDKALIYDRNALMIIEEIDPETKKVNKSYLRVKIK